MISKGVIALALLALPSFAANIVITNDDGWAAANIRAAYQSLTDAGHNVVLSAPAENESEKAILQFPPTPVLNGCEFNTCPPLSPSTGSDPSDAHLNYVNSFPVTAVKYGLSTFGPAFFNGQRPDLVVSGPNIGPNIGKDNLVSGTVGAAGEAAQQGIPSIAFSGVSGELVSYTTLDTDPDSPDSKAAKLYAELATNFVGYLLDAPGGPSIPPENLLNVNFPAVTDECSDPSAFKYVLTRVFSASIISGKDVNTCGNNNRLPTETSIVNGGGCLISVSVMNAITKTDASASSQAAVLSKLSDILVCA